MKPNRISMAPKPCFTTLESGRVTRYHAAPTVAPQSNGQHQWGVATIVLYITQGKCSKDLLVEALMHDTAEYFTGDLPFTFKRDNPELKKFIVASEAQARINALLVSPLTLTAKEEAILKVADTLEGFYWCRSNERGTLIGDRWHVSLHIARNKFSNLLSPAEWDRVEVLKNQISKNTQHENHH